MCRMVFGASPNLIPGSRLILCVVFAAHHRIPAHEIESQLSRLIVTEYVFGRSYRQKDIENLETTISTDVVDPKRRQACL